MSPNWDRASSYVGSPFLKCATVSRVPPLLRGEPPDGGCVAAPRVYFRGPEYVGGVEHEAGGGGRLEERAHVAPPSRMGLQRPPQPFCCLCVPGARRARPTNLRGSRLGVRSRALQ